MHTFAGPNGNVKANLFNEKYLHETFHLTQYFNKLPVKKTIFIDKIQRKSLDRDLRFHYICAWKLTVQLATKQADAEMEEWSNTAYGW